jgi:hypothetical protein
MCLMLQRCQNLYEPEERYFVAYWKGRPKWDMVCFVIGMVNMWAAIIVSFSTEEDSPEPYFTL